LDCASSGVAVSGFEVNSLFVPIGALILALLSIVADENMPGLEHFSALGQVVRLPGRAMTADQVRDADVLLVRSITRVDRALLVGSRVGFVGSATIGTDHVDLEWLATEGIAFAHAPGCNAMAVAEYALQAALAWMVDRGLTPRDLRAGIVGYGNVGRLLTNLLEALGMQVLVCDPPLERTGVQIPGGGVDLAQVLSCDLVSLHVPLMTSGTDATRHLIGGDQLSALREGQLLVNTCRGAVIDNQALLARLHAPCAPEVVLDVWENEPDICAGLFARARVGTPHIAGHSVEGKLRGTGMLRAALAGWLGQTPSDSGPLAGAGEYSGSVTALPELLDLLRSRYDQRRDHAALALSLNSDQPAAAFDQLRKHYPPRHELAGTVVAGTVASEYRALLNRLAVMAGTDSASGAPGTRTPA
jgi:erythronate-4-phosphate dehydrogenase